MIEYKKHTIKKVYYNHIIVDKRFKPNILYRFKVLKS